MNDDHCKNCGAELTECPEPEHPEHSATFIRCMVCGAKNVLSVEALEIIGWHE